MSDDPKVLAKVASVLVRMPDSEDLVKESSRLGKALKVTGLVGASAGTGMTVGSMLGEKSGRKKQLELDLTRFRTAASNIYNMGRTHGMVSLANKIKQRFSSGLKGISGGSGMSTLPKLNQPAIKKASLDKMALAVYNGWVSGQIPTEHIQNLPPRDMTKISAVVLSKMDDGDQVASILWNLISDA